MRLDEQAIRALSQVRDPMGVLSIYACTTPERQANERPEWAIGIKRELHRLREDVKEAGPRERWVALQDRLDEIGPQLEVLLDPSNPGRGRAFFVPLSGDGIEDLAIQMPLPDRVVLADAPYVGPLVTAFDEGRPAGVAIVDRHGVRLLGWVAGEGEDVARFPFDESQAEDWREMRGKPPARGSHLRQGVSHRESFEQRMDDNRDRALRRAAARVDAVIADRGWDRLLIFSDERLHAFEDALRSDVAVVRSDMRFGDVPASDVADAATPLLIDAHRRREIELVDLAKDRAAAGGRGAAGLEPTVAALNDGRVDRLLLDPSLRVSGYRAPDGRLSPTPDDGFEPDEDLAERMVEVALATSAWVTPVEGEAAEHLSDVGGVAAILRW